MSTLTHLLRNKHEATRGSTKITYEKALLHGTKKHLPSVNDETFKNICDAIDQVLRKVGANYTIKPLVHFNKPGEVDVLEFYDPSARRSNSVEDLLRQARVARPLAPGGTAREDNEFEIRFNVYEKQNKDNLLQEDCALQYKLVGGAITNCRMTGQGKQMRS